jgi:FkbM family methyltransferase
MQGWSVALEPNPATTVPPSAAIVPGAPTGMLNGLRTRLELLRGHPIARRQRLRTLGRFAKAEILNRAMGRPFLFRHDFGVTLIVDRNLHSTRGHYFFGIHDFHEELFLIHFLRDAELFIDVGANLGVFSILVAQTTGARVVAFEPSPSSAKMMKMQIAMNGLADRVYVYEACAGNSVGRVSFKDSVSMDNSVVLDDRDRTSALVDVPMLRIDDVVQPEGSCVMKMDVEGFEKQALEGALGLLANSALRALVVETRGICSRFGYSTNEIAALILRNGFMAVRYDPLTRRISRAETHENSTAADEANTFFVRDLQETQERVAAAPRRRIFGLTV